MMSATIHDIAAQFDRLCPSQVDTSIAPNGQQEAGHVGHDDDGILSVGWTCAGGNCGERLCTIPAASIHALYERLAALDDGALDDGGLSEIVREYGGEW